MAKVGTDWVKCTMSTWRGFECHLSLCKTGSTQCAASGTNQYKTTERGRLYEELFLSGAGWWHQTNRKGISETIPYTHYNKDSKKTKEAKQELGIHGKNQNP